MECYNSDHFYKDIRKEKAWTDISAVLGVDGDSDSY